jgi:branched-chain amino acid transport system substrate-binding protein
MVALRRLVLTLTLLLALAGCTARSSPEPIVVGHLAPLSGPDRAAGEHAQHGIDLAVDEVNQPGSRINDRPVNVVHADTAGDAEAVQAQTVRLITTRRPVALLGGTDASQLERISRAAPPYALPVVSPATWASPPAGEYLFSTAVTPTYQGMVLGRFTREALKPAGVLVLSDSRSDVATALTAGFVTEVGQGGTVKTDEATYHGEADFPNLIGRVKKARPQAVLVAGAVADLVKLRPQLHAAAPEAALVLGAEEGALPALAEDRTTPGTAYLASSFAAEGLTGKGQDVARQYRERFGHDLDVHAALAYDAARLLFEAIRRARAGNGVQVGKELPNVEHFESVTGPLAFARDHTALRSVFVLRLEEGKARLSMRYDPETK